MALYERIRAPVFIVGAPRSGTTLLRVTLNRHSQLAMCGETAYFQRLYARRRAFGDPANLRSRGRIVEAYLALEPVGRLGMDIGVLRERLMSEGVSWRDLFASLLQVYADSRGKPHCGEKTPAHALHVHTLCQWFPDCTIVHLVRDPRAVVYSMMRMPWATRSALMGARTWRLFSSGACAASSRANYILVKYEELVTRTEEQLRRLCHHIGLEYQEAMLQPKPGELIYARVDHRPGEKITAERVALWRSELKPWQVSAIEVAAGDRMQEFGYQRQTNGTTANMARASLEAVVEMTFQKLLRAPSIFRRLLQPTNLADEDKWLRRAWAIYARLRSLPPATIRTPRR